MKDLNKQGNIQKPYRNDLNKKLIENNWSNQPIKFADKGSRKKEANGFEKVEEENQVRKKLNFGSERSENKKPKQFQSDLKHSMRQSKM